MKLGQSIWFLVCALLLCSYESAYSQEPTGLDAQWQADWIGIDQPAKPNQWICFRKAIRLDSKPETAIAKIACDSKYWLWINGEMVVREGQLKRGPTPNSTYYDEVDLQNSFQSGENTIAILMWHFGKQGFSHHSSGKAGLIFDATVDQGRVTTDGSWKAVEHPAFGDTGPPNPNYRLPESNIRFDAQQEMTNAGRTWFQAGFNDSQWPAATEIGKPPCLPWGDLTQRPTPQWKDFGLKPFENQVALNLPRKSDGKVLVAKLPYNAQVNPYLKIRSVAGKTIDIRMDNYRGGSAPNVRAHYVTREGEQTWEAPGWMNGHEVHYLIPKGVEVLDLNYRETGFDTQQAGIFECDDDFLNQLHKKSARTLYVTMRDTYFDCPDRERAQWWGDAVLEMGEAFYVLDTQSHSLARKGILELMGWQRDDGTIFSPIPAGNYDSELPMQMLASVGHFGFWTYGLYSGDLETIKTVYPRVARYLTVWKISEEGVVVPRKGGWAWGDWGKNKDMPLLYNGWYYLALKGQSEMATALGRDDEAQLIVKKMNRLKDSFNRTFWNGSEYRSPKYKGLTDDRGNALAVVSGIAGADKFEAISKVLMEQRHSSPYMEKYVMEALYKMRRPNQAIDRIKQRYQKMVSAKTTTLWEGWGIGAEGFGGGTINHAWSGGPLTVMYQYIVGIQPLKPGFREYEIRPQLGPLKSASATVATTSGKIEVEIEDSPKLLTINVDSPTATVAKVYIPANGITSVTKAGRTVWSSSGDSLSPGGNESAGRISSDGLYIEFEIAPGAHQFRALK